MAQHHGTFVRPPTQLLLVELIDYAKLDSSTSRTRTREVRWIARSTNLQRLRVEISQRSVGLHSQNSMSHMDMETRI